MRAARNSPLFRIALLSLAVLFAHTAGAHTQLINPVCPPCPGKVAAAQPEAEKKPPLASVRIVKPKRFAGGHSLFNSLDFAAAHRDGLLSVHSAGQNILARRAALIAPQRWPFALRI